MANLKKRKCNPRKTTTKVSSPVDRISNLPENLIEAILVLLPLRDAARTSVLSTKWRYCWLTLPQLVFDDTLIKDSLDNQILLQSKLLITVYQILLLHSGPIVKFTLSISKLENCSEIYPLILFLSRNNINELTIDIFKGDKYILPSPLFSCQKLRLLKLSYCRFEPPPTFNGFSKLINLEFSEVEFAGGVLESLLSSCPLLERLTLEGSILFDHLEIDAPRLNFLSISCNYGSIHFKNSPLLALVSITSGEDVALNLKNVEKGEASEMLEAFGCLPVIESLKLGFRFVKFLINGGVPERLLFTLDHLKVLQLSEIYFGEVAEVSFVLCLIKSSPNLRKIELKVFTSNTGNGPGPLVLEFLEMQDHSDVSLNQLREVKMQSISGSRPELLLIELILAKSPVLETILIESRSKMDAENGAILTELTRFRRASPTAQMIYKTAQ